MNVNGFWWRLLHLDPVLFRSAVIAVVALLLSVGIVVSPAVSDSLITAVWALSAVVAALWSKAGVVPNAKVVAYQPDPVNYPAAILSGPATAEGATDTAVMSAARRSRDI